jgi:hypothetical protein
MTATDQLVTVGSETLPLNEAEARSESLQEAVLVACRVYAKWSHAIADVTGADEYEPEYIPDPAKITPCPQWCGDPGMVCDGIEHSRSVDPEHEDPDHLENFAVCISNDAEDDLGEVIWLFDHLLDNAGSRAHFTLDEAEARGKRLLEAVRIARLG